MSAESRLIEIHNISRVYAHEYGLVHALKNVNFSLNKGESVSIMGPSGSGKSTLMHLMGCLDRPTTGTYHFNLQDVSLLNDREISLLRASQIGFVFQAFNLISQLTVFENLQVPFLYQIPALNETEIKERIVQALERVHLGHRLHHLPSQLSGGEAQRAAIARALAIRPLLILADEPTGNLDTETEKTVLRYFQELGDDGVSLVVVTHDPHVAAQFSRTVHMKDGLLCCKE